MPRYIVIPDDWEDQSTFNWIDVEASDPAEAVVKANLDGDGPFHVYGVSNYNRYRFEPKRLVRDHKEIP